MKSLTFNKIENLLNQNGKNFSILNEAVNLEKKCIFIAIPKTGTTSVRCQLQQQGKALISNPHLNIIQVRDSLYVYFLMSSLGNNINYPTEAVISDIEIRAAAKKIFEKYFKFSAVRNPWARAVSLYFRKESIQVSSKISFEQFCDHHIYASDTCHHPTLHQNQFDWLCDEDGKMVMDYVYKLENFEEARKEILQITEGRVKLSNKVKNQNIESNANDYRVMYSEKSRNIIARVFEKDIDYFKYSFF